MKTDREFLYHNVIIKIFKTLFGYSYVFTYANIDYEPISFNYLNAELAGQEAKTHVDQILTKKNNYEDDFGINV